MTVGGIGQYGGLLNSYAYQNIQKVDVETVKQQDAERIQRENTPQSFEAARNIPAVQDNRSRISNLEDVSLSMRAESDLEFLGQESGIQLLDMDKAISDMQKDSILQDYNYFVGNQSGIMSQSEDGIVLRK